MTAFILPHYKKSRTRKTAFKMSEHELQKSILEFLKLKNIFAWQNKTQGTFDPRIGRFRSNPHTLKGVSDILGIYKGKFLAIEVKTEKGKATDEQLAFIHEVKRQGGWACIARSIEDVDIFLKGKE